MTLIIIFIGILVLLLVCYAILKAGSNAQNKIDEINRQEYQKRLDTKGGNK